MNKLELVNNEILHKISMHLQTESEAFMDIDECVGEYLKNLLTEKDLENMEECDFNTEQIKESNRTQHD